MPANEAAASPSGVDDDMAHLTGSLAAIWAQALEATQESVCDLKIDLQERFDSELASKDAEIAARDEQIAELSATVAKLKIDQGGAGDAMGTVKDRLAQVFGLGKSATKATLLHTKIFLHWRAYATMRCERVKLYHVARAVFARKAKQRILNAWIGYFTGVSRDKDRLGAQELLKKTAEEIVKRYDGRITMLESQLYKAQQEVQDGHRRRQHLEDELRRTLLKGMNAMNLEALHIFQHASGVDALKAPGLGLDAPPPPHFDSAFLQTAAGAAFGAPPSALSHPPQPAFGAAPAPVPSPSPAYGAFPGALRAGQALPPAVRLSGNGLSGSMEGMPRPRGSAPRPTVERHVGRTAK